MANYFCPNCGYEGMEMVCPFCGETTETLEWQNPEKELSTSNKLEGEEEDWLPLTEESEEALE